MTRQVSNGRSIDTASGVNVDGVDDFKCGSGTIHLALGLILTSRGK